MPRYEFVCKKCGKTFEKLLSINDRDTPQRCEHCNSKKTERVITAHQAVIMGASPSRITAADIPPARPR